MEIEDARNEDLASILNVFERSVRKIASRDYDRSQIEAWLSSVNNKDKWLSRIEDQNFKVAKESGVICGFASIDHSGYLDVLFVNPKYAGQGVAKSLVEDMILFARKNSIRKIHTFSSITAKPFFERMGFNIEHENEVEINGVILNNFKMRLLL